MTTPFRVIHSGDSVSFEGVKRGLTPDSELMHRQQCAQLIQEIGLVQRHLENIQLTINAAISIMHQFYVKFSPIQFKPIFVAITSFYIACKVKDTAKKAEYILDATYKAFNWDLPKLEKKKKLVQSIHALEGIMLLSVGFENAHGEQPWDYLLPLLHNLKAPKSVMIASSYISTNMLLLTTLSLRYDPSLLAAASFNLATKWHGLKLSDILNKSGQSWHNLIKCKKTININFEIVNKITAEFLDVYKNAPVLIHNKLNQLQENSHSSVCNTNEDTRSPSMNYFDSKSYANSCSVTPSHILSRSTTPVANEPGSSLMFNGKTDTDTNDDNSTFSETFETLKNLSESPQKSKKSAMSFQEYLSRKKSNNSNSHRTDNGNGSTRIEYSKSHVSRDSNRHNHPDKTALDKSHSANNNEVSRELKSSPHSGTTHHSRLPRAHSNSSMHKSDISHHSHSSSSLRHHSGHASHQKSSTESSRFHANSTSGSSKHHSSSREHKDVEVKKEKRHRQDSSSGNDHSTVKRQRLNSQSSSSSHKHSRLSSHSYDRRPSHNQQRHVVDAGDDIPPPTYNGDVTPNSKEKSGAYDPADNEFTDLF